MFTPSTARLSRGGCICVMFTIHAFPHTVKFPSRGTAPSDPHDLPGDRIGILPPPSLILCLLMMSVSLASASLLIEPGICEKSVNTLRTCFASSSFTHEGMWCTFTNAATVMSNPKISMAATTVEIALLSENIPPEPFLSCLRLCLMFLLLAGSWSVECLFTLSPPYSRQVTVATFPSISMSFNSRWIFPLSVMLTLV